MSPRGWVKGRPRGPASPKVQAALARGRAIQKMKGAAMASGRTMPESGFNRDFRPEAASIDTSKAAWLPAGHYVSEYQYVEDGLDEVLLRALRERVVYASSGCHREPPFQDITTDVLAATERYARKNGIPPRKMPRPTKTKVVVRKIALVPAPVPVAHVTRVGKGLLEVVSEMFDP